MGIDGAPKAAEIARRVAEARARTLDPVADRTDAAWWRRENAGAEHSRYLSSSTPDRRDVRAGFRACAAAR